MPDQNNPTVLVKKADGTYVKVPLSELKKMQTTVQPAAVVAPTAPKGDQKKEIVEKSETVTKFETKKIVEPQIRKDQKDENSKSAPTTTSTETTVSKEKQVDEIVSNLSFKAPVGNNNRLRTIIQLFLKEIRSEDETEETLMRPEIQGGVGLSLKQAKEVIEKTKIKKEVLEEKNKKTEPIKPKSVEIIKEQDPIKKEAPVVQKFDKKENERLEKEVPMIKQSAPFPAVKPLQKIQPTLSAQVKPLIAPVVKKVENLKPISEEKKVVAAFPVKITPTKSILDEQTTKITLSEIPAVIEPFKIKEDKNKTTMSDVTHFPIEVGPVDEIKFFNLTDFRRLSSNPTDAAGRLKQKFINLREESILLFFDAIDAWHTCPLYLDYIGLVSEALSKKENISKLSQDRRRIQLSEMMAILQMERELI